MRSRRFTFRRPAPPSIDQFVDQLESNLRQAMAVAPPTRPSRLQRAWDRWSRWMLRPVAHGSLALAMVFFAGVATFDGAAGVALPLLAGAAVVATSTFAA